MKKLLNLSSVVILIRRYIYFTLWTIDKYVLNRQSKIIILSYHGFANDNWKYSVNVSTFKNQVAQLKKEGYIFISLSELIRCYQNIRRQAGKFAVVTIDDGYKNVLSVQNFLSLEKISPTLFLLGDTKNANRVELATQSSFLNTSEINSLIKDKWEIGSHSLTHSNLLTLSNIEARQEVIHSKKNLESQFKIKISYFAYPRGKYTAQILKYVKQAGYKAGVSMNDAFFGSKLDLMLLPRIGVDRTHSTSEFKTIYSPSVIKFRQIIKSTFLGGYL